MRLALQGAVFHELPGDHDHSDPFLDQERADAGGEGRRAAMWGHENVDLLTVGVDVGSSTSHLLFARLHLQRQGTALSSRFVVVGRDVLYRSPILLTPYRPDGLIDVAALEQFVHAAYQQAGLGPDRVDTGAVILTGTALERANARAVAELFASEGGKFVCASAGHNLEALLSAHGSGAVELSRQRAATVLHVDVGGGTSKLTLAQGGEILQTAALGVGGRLVAVDTDSCVTRIEHVAQDLARKMGLSLALGEPLPATTRQYLATTLATRLVEALRGEDPYGRVAPLWLTPPLNATPPDYVTFSGGVAEYIYGRETTRFGDLAQDMAAVLRDAIAGKMLPAPVLPLEQGIRATVIGASQFSVQVSGNTLHLGNAARLPIRNLPVVRARLQNEGALTEPAVEEAIRSALRRLDVEESATRLALALDWRGEPTYNALRALAGGVVTAMPATASGKHPLVIVLESDVGRSLGHLLANEMGVQSDLLVVDGLHLRELDYVDIGELIRPANVVPVVIKSLAFA